ncbi:LacI family DNA-binding transcriptional regulator [Tropicibacter naphthalenivorans]|uniref:Glucose-resistance amylase regulator n=1 Tax=Tropicibacter naphthalenivorans TaxID=441103 RepID=A0A0P1GKR7_9RHOB|nr:LacI family DNA-binding transcriptional regulator [Tropicibacter naphthalenivorans]CUH82571.1 Glucose-resistance amylase regulator [Tropicibacter naphthalenivorans]SMD09301.1 transcriptional regulator, LacI family [Tropicibacter naphthalenivorans]
MRRPTIPDLARAAGVSVSTVNRVINQADSVRKPTRDRVLAAAQDIGFYGIGSIEHSVRKARETHTLGVLLHQQSRTFYRNLAAALHRAADSDPTRAIKLRVDFVEDLSPDNMAAQLTALGAECDAVALVGAEHPLLSDAIDSLLDRGVPVVGMIAPLSARGNVGFVGLDNRKVGRTAGWAFDKIIKEPGKIGILLGNPRYRNQEMNESGFRSYLRENNDAFTLLEPLSTYESAAAARELTEKLLTEHPDLCGLFVSGGGITGAIAALRAVPHRKDFVAVGYELFDTTRAALIDGTLTMVLSHPMDDFARQTIATLIKAKKAGPEAGAQRTILGFELYTAENV